MLSPRETSIFDPNPEPGGHVVDAARVMATLAEACIALETAGEYAAAAHVGHAMDIVSERHGIPVPPAQPPLEDPR